MNSGAGLDGIENRFIKLASHIFMYQSADLFNLFLSTCELPALWKCAPLSEGGAAHITILELYLLYVLLLKPLHFHMISESAISDHHLNLASGLSTPTTAWLKFTNDVLSAADNGELTGAVDKL